MPLCFCLQTCHNITLFQLKRLWIVDPFLSPDGYTEIAVVLKKANCPNVILVSCDLTEEKLREFKDSCQTESVKV